MDFSQLSGDDQLGFAIPDDAVTEGLARFGCGDFPGRAGAALLAFGFSRFDDSVGLTFSFGSFPEEFDCLRSSVHEDDGEGAAVRFRGRAGTPAPLQGGQGFQGGLFKGREFFGSERAKLGEFLGVLLGRREVGPFEGIGFDVVEFFVAIGVVKIAPIFRAHAIAARLVEVGE